MKLLVKADKEDLPYKKCYAAHCFTSHSPEKRAIQEQEAYVRFWEAINLEFNGYLENREELIVTCASDLGVFKKGYLTKKLAQLHSESKVAGSFFVGPANLSQRAMDRKTDTAGRKLTALVDYTSKRLTKLRKKYDPSKVSKVIYSSQPDAVKQLKIKLALVVKKQELIKKVNRITKHKKLDITDKVEQLFALDIMSLVDAIEVGLTEKNEAIQKLLDGSINIEGRLGFPQHTITGYRLEEKYIRERLHKIEREINKPPVKPTSVTYGEFTLTIIENKEKMRLQVRVDDYEEHTKEENKVLYKDMRKHGLIYYKTGRLFQRKLNNNARRTINSWLGTSLVLS